MLFDQKAPNPPTNIENVAIVMKTIPNTKPRVCFSSELLLMAALLQVTQVGTAFELFE